jgi:hypothetical protein
MLKIKHYIVASLIIFTLTLHLSAAAKNPIAKDTSKSSPTPLAKTAPSVSTVEVPIPSAESLADPNELLPEQKAALQSETQPTDPTEKATTVKFWQRNYHPQVNARIFDVLCYPYYTGGKSYPLSDVLPPRDSVENTDAVPQEDPNQVHQDSQPESIRYNLETCFDLIHQWRNCNESVGTTLEIVRAIELTRRATGIYHINPTLAIDVKRTLGHIGRLNRTFDRTSRLTLQNLLKKQNDKLLTVRLEKHINNLYGLLERLAKQNDAITVALGIGKIDRQARHAPIYYIDLGLPNIPSELYKKQ